MKTKSLLILIIVLTMTDCRKQYYNTYTVINDTSHQILIEGFTLTTKTWKQSITINPHLTYSVDKRTNSKEYEDQGIFELESIDSVCIIFDSTRIISYACYGLSPSFCDTSRNIIKFNKYYKESCDKQECTYTYTITEEDYANADTLK